MAEKSPEEKKALQERWQTFLKNYNSGNYKSIFEDVIKRKDITVSNIFIFAYKRILEQIIAYYSTDIEDILTGQGLVKFYDELTNRNGEPITENSSVEETHIALSDKMYKDFEKLNTLFLEYVAKLESGEIKSHIANFPEDTTHEDK